MSTSSAENVVPLRIFVRPERRFVAERRPTELVVLVRLIPAAVESQPLNLAVGLDTACSPEELASAKAGIEALARSLAPDDTLRLVVGGRTVRCVADNLAGSAAIADALSQVAPDSASDLHSTWFGAAFEAAHHAGPDCVSRVLLLSAAGPGSAGFEDEGRGLFRRTVSTSVVGLGHGFDEDGFDRLARRSGGNVWYAHHAEAVVRSLAHDVKFAREVFSEWATLQLETNEAEVMEVVNGFSWIDGNKLRLPPLYAEVPMHVVLRVRIRPHAAGEELMPLSVRVKCVDLHARRAVAYRKRLRLDVVAGELADGMAPDASVQAEAARMEFAKTQDQCVARLDAGDVAAARQLLEFSIARFRSLEGQEGSTLLTTELARMARARAALDTPDGTGRARKILRLSAGFARRGGPAHPVRD